MSLVIVEALANVLSPVEATAELELDELEELEELEELDELDELEELEELDELEEVEELDEDTLPSHETAANIIHMAARRITVVLKNFLIIVYTLRKTMLIVAIDTEGDN